MLKKGLVFPVIVVIGIFIVLSASIILLQEKKLTGFAIYNSPTNTCEATMSDNFIFTAQIRKRDSKNN